jgi:hypothetical protein
MGTGNRRRECDTALKKYKGPICAECGRFFDPVTMEPEPVWVESEYDRGNSLCRECREFWEMEVWSAYN